MAAGAASTGLQVRERQKAMPAVPQEPGGTSRRSQTLNSSAPRVSPRLRHRGCRRQLAMTAMLPPSPSFPHTQGGAGTLSNAARRVHPAPLPAGDKLSSPSCFLPSHLARGPGDRFRRNVVPRLPSPRSQGTQPQQGGPRRCSCQTLGLQESKASCHPRPGGLCLQSCSATEGSQASVP